MERVILHVDINNCYASIECLVHPELRGKAVAVGGSVEERNGIILAKNQLAKSFGVTTGEALWQAKQKCPQLVIVRPNFPLYVEFSRKARAIYEEYTKQVESFGIDECWLDVTWLGRDGYEIADEIRCRIKDELGITVSVGVSFNKVFAKLGSDIKKPDAVTMITPENFRDVVWKLPASDMLFIGRKTYKKLENYGIHTIGELAQTNVKLMKNWFGKCGMYMWQHANGIDDTPVSFSGENSIVKSVSNGTTTYRDIDCNSDAKILIYALAESVGMRMREIGMRCRCISISIRDKDLFWITRQMTLSAETDDTVTIAKKAYELFLKSYSFENGGKPVRSLSVGASDLSGRDTPFQLDIFVSPEKLARQEKLNLCVDSIKKRFGYTSIRHGIVFENLCFSGVDMRFENEAGMT